MFDLETKPMRDLKEAAFRELVIRELGEIKEILAKLSIKSIEKDSANA